jgi:hypothetical protein
MSAFIAALQSAFITAFIAAI